MPSFVKEVGRSVSAGAQATYAVVVPALGVLSGRFLAVYFASPVTTGATCTDSRGNVYTLDLSGGSASPALGVFTSVLTTALQPGDVITVAGAGGTPRIGSVVVAEFAGVQSGYDVRGYTADVTISGAGHYAAPSVGPTTAASELILGAFVVEETLPTAETFTPDAPWNGLTLARNGSNGFSNVTLYPLYQIAAATGSFAVAGNLTPGGNADAGLVTYRSIPMAEPISALSFCGIGLETTAGVPVLSQVELDYVSETLGGKGEPIKRRSINRVRAHKGAVQGPYRAEGDLVVEMTPDKVTKVLYAALTGLTTTGSADPYTHVFKTGNTLKPLTVQILRDDTYFLYPGQFVQRLSFKAVIDAIVEMTVGLAGMGSEKLYNAEQSDAGIAASAEDPFVFYQGAIQLAGGANTDTNNWQVDINTGLTTPKNLGAGRNPNRAHAGDSVVSGSFDMVFDSITEHRKWMGAANNTYPIQIGNNVQTLAMQLLFTASANRTLTIDIPKAYYKASGPHVTGREGVIIQRLDFDTLWDTVNATDIKVTLKSPDSGTVITTLGTNAP